MAKLRAYAKGTTEYAEWDLHESNKGEEIAGQLASTKSDALLTIPTSTGWVRLKALDWAALEIIE